MAHRRDELVFHPLELVAFGDVAECDDDADRTALAAGRDRAGRELHGNGLAAAGAKKITLGYADRWICVCAADKARLCRLLSLGRRGMDELMQCAPEELIDRPPQHLRAGGIDERNASCGIETDDSIPGRAEDHVLFRAQLRECLGLLAERYRLFLNTSGESDLATLQCSPPRPESETDQPQKTDYTRRIKPLRLGERRIPREGKRRAAGGVPFPIRAGGFHAEDVVARRKIRVDR